MGREWDGEAHHEPVLEGLVSELVKTRRRIARLQAHESQLLAQGIDVALGRVASGRASEGDHRLRPALERDVPLREVAAEFAAAMRLSDRTVQMRMGSAASLVTRFTATFEAWEGGRIDAAHVSAIVDAGAPIADDTARAEYERRVLLIAAHESPTRLRTHARVLAGQVAPEVEDDAIQRAHEARRIRVFDLDDDTARLIADGPATLMHAIYDRLTAMARTIKDAPVEIPRDADDGGAGAEAVAADGEATAIDDDRVTVVTGPTVRRDRAAVDDDADGEVDESAADAAVSGSPLGEARSLDQLRTDVLTDLLLAGAPVAHGDCVAAIRAEVQITIPALTLLGAGNEAPILGGYGPIDPATARRLAAQAPGWTRVLTDPVTGVPVAVDRYRPSKKQKRYLGVRDEHCRFPGCQVPVRRSDLDHTIDFATGGSTSIGNLAHLCRRHHVIKHHTAWSVTQLPGGSLQWRSPAGRHYTDRPPAEVRFVPSDRTDPAAWAKAPACGPAPF